MISHFLPVFPLSKSVVVFRSSFVVCFFLLRRVSKRLVMEDTFGDHLAQPLCLELCQLQQVSQGHGQVSVDYLQEWRLSNISEQLGPLFNCPHNEEVLSYVWMEFPVYQCVFYLCCFLWAKSHYFAFNQQEGNDCISLCHHDKSKGPWGVLAVQKQALLTQTGRTILKFL